MLDNMQRFAFRRRWWLGVPACVVSVGTVIALAFVPSQYTSEATLIIVQQQIPERYVVPTTTTDINTVLGAMAGEVLSRTRLLAIIDSLNLYSHQKARTAPEALVDLMRRNITMAPVAKTPGRMVDAFSISFTADDPRIAKEVTGRLTDVFISENIKTRTDQATTTTGFLREQVEAAKQKLTDHEERLRNFKMQYLGELPEQQQGNLNILGGLHSELDNIMTALNRARQQKLYLESLLNEYRRLNRRTVTAAVGPSAESPLQLAQRDLARMRSELVQLRSRYTENYPDVVYKEEEVGKQEAVVTRLAQSEPRRGPTRQPLPPSADPDPEANTAIAQLNSQLNANGLEIEDLTRSRAKVSAEIEHYQSRLNLAPVREQQLTAMLRDYDLLKQNYTDLLHKQLQAQLAGNLEKRQEGQQFRLVDPPNLPLMASSPKRLKISLGGLAAGLVFGLALAVLADKRDSSVHSEQLLSERLHVPLIVAIPRIRTHEEQRAVFRKRVLESVAGSLLILAILAAQLHVILQRG